MNNSNSHDDSHSYEKEKKLMKNENELTQALKQPNFHEFNSGKRTISLFRETKYIFGEKESLPE